MSKSHTAGRTHASDTHVVKGAGLARGPALILGAILSAAGLALFLHAGATPTGGFPDGDATGSKILGFESNGWTAFFTTTAGVVLLFAAAQHLLAKTLGLVVGLALAACVVLDLVNGPGVLGLAAANWAVDLAWAIAAGILLLNVFAPRIKKEEPAATDRADLARDDHRHDSDHHRPHLPGTHRDESHRDGDRHDGPHLPGTHRDETHGDGDRHDGPHLPGTHREHDTPVADGAHREPGVEAPRSSTTGTAPAAGDGVSPSAGSTRIDR